MNLKTYLMEWDPKRFQQARDEGLLDDPKNTTGIEVPEWLRSHYHKMKFHGTYGYKLNDQEFKTTFINFFSNQIFDYDKTQFDFGQNVKIVLTKQGKIFWGIGYDLVHQYMIDYMMLIGVLPLNELLGQYMWVDEPDSFDFILCLEQLNQELFYSDSYEDQDKIILKEATENYNHLIKKIGFTEVLKF